jgi:acyl-coenzyme A synthetase/AMP-(fatty) acid ligase
MMQRILQLPQEVLDRYDLTSVEVVAVSGSALPGDLSSRWMDRFGETLHNVYGSTEVACATVATPGDLRESPGTAGTPPYGSVLRVVDDRGRQVPDGSTGRIVVGNGMIFEGYTDGGTKDYVGGLMSTGDLGHLDVAGRLTVEGREDEMIVSGGENVFPAEVEDALARHAAVVEAACVPVDDEVYGRRLRAFVVLTEPGRTDEDELKRHVGAILARYKVPREVVFLDALPRNGTGKVLKRALEEREYPT